MRKIMKSRQAHCHASLLWLSERFMTCTWTSTYPPPRCNLFETASASEWTLYISEWQPAPGGALPLSNIRVTTKVMMMLMMRLVMMLVMMRQVLQSQHPSCWFGHFDLNGHGNLGFFIVHFSSGTRRWPDSEIKPEIADHLIVKNVWVKSRLLVPGEIKMCYETNASLSIFAPARSHFTFAYFCDLNLAMYTKLPTVLVQS